MRRGLIWGCLFVSACVVTTSASATTPAFRPVRIAVDPDGGGDATLSPDGRQFVATSRRSGNWEVWTYDIASATWTQRTDHPADDFEARFSPDGKRLVFCSTRTGQKDIWLLDLADGALRQLTFSPDDDEYPVWSVDGRNVIYTGGPWTQRDFMIVSAEGGTPRRLSRFSGRAGACSADPKGDSLVCHRYDLGTGHVVRLMLADGTESALTQGPVWDYKPSVSPDSRWIAFSRSEEGPARIALMPAAGGEVVALTRSAGEDRWPSWSASGDRIFFHRVLDTGSAVKTLDRRTGAVRTLVGADEAPLQAAVDPHGRRLAYCSQTAAGRVVRILDLASGATSTLTTPGQACYPRFSPDGERLAFAAKDAGRWEIAVARLDGSELVVLTRGMPGLRGMDGPLDWSPDGTRVLFQADTRPFEANLFAVEPATGRVEALTSDNWFDEAPAWTPDGEGIVFMSTRGGNWTWGLFRLSLKDHTLQTLAGPDWVEKNYPRLTADGAMVWNTQDEQRGELLAERSPDGKVRLRPEAGRGVRWPSFWDAGRSIVYTTVEHGVEYWMLENPLGSGSPLLERPTQARPQQPTTPTRPRPIAQLERSPVDLHHR